MKNLRKFMLGFVAVLTVSIVLMAHGKVFKKGGIAYDYDCFKPSVSVKSSCSDFPTELNLFTLCVIAEDYEGSHLFDLNGQDFIPLEQVSTECLGGDIFCCATIRPDFAPCFDQPAYFFANGGGYYKIDQIYCKEQD